MNAIRHPLQWWKTAAREHWLPLLLLVPVIVWTVYQADVATNATPMLPLPIAAFAIGSFLRPRHVWLIWLGSVVLTWIAILGYATLIGFAPSPPELGSDEGPVSIMVESFGYMAVGVLLPVWLGRMIRAAFGEAPPKQAPPA